MVVFSSSVPLCSPPASPGLREEVGAGQSLKGAWVPPSLPTLLFTDEKNLSHQEGKSRGRVARSRSQLPRLCVQGSQHHRSLSFQCFAAAAPHPCLRPKPSGVGSGGDGVINDIRSRRAGSPLGAPTIKPLHDYFRADPPFHAGSWVLSRLLSPGVPVSVLGRPLVVGAEPTFTLHTAPLGGPGSAENLESRGNKTRKQK